MDPITVGFGDTVRLNSSLVGIVRFIGYTEFKRNILFYGIDLKEAMGEHDGKYENRRYYKCRKLHGVFVRRSDIDAVVYRRSVGPPLCIGQRVQIIDSLQNNRKIGKGRLRFVGLTVFDDFRHYLYGVEMDRNIGGQLVPQMMLNPHIYLVGSVNGGDCFDGEGVNRYFDAEAKRSVFVRRDQLKVVSKEKERRHSTKHHTLRHHESLRNRFRLNDDGGSSPYTVTLSKERERERERDIDCGRRLRSRSAVPGRQRYSEQKRTLKSAASSKRKSRRNQDSDEFGSRRRESQPIVTCSRFAGSRSNGLVVVSSHESSGDFNGCSITPEMKPIDIDSGTPSTTTWSEMSELTLSNAVSAGYADIERAEREWSAPRRESKSGNGNMDRVQTQKQKECRGRDHIMNHHDNDDRVESLRLKKRHSTPISIGSDQRCRQHMMPSQEMTTPIHEDEEYSVCFGEDEVSENEGSDDLYFQIINDRDKLRRFVDRKHFYYHHQFAEDSKHRDAVQLMASIKKRSPPPSMGTYFSWKSRMNRRKKRALPSVPREYAVQIDRRPMGFFIETKRLRVFEKERRESIVHVTIDGDGRQRRHRMRTDFKMVNAYISSIVEEEWHSVLLIGSQLLSINGEDITGWSFSKIFKKLTTEPLPFVLRLAAPTQRNRKGYRAETVDAVQREDGVRKEEEEEEEEVAVRGTVTDIGRNERGLTMDETKLKLHALSDKAQRRNKLKFRLKLF